MIPTHNLIDPENPKCLYCHNLITTIVRDSQSIIGTGLYQDNETFICLYCKEHFIIITYLDSNNETEYIAFGFTTENYAIYHWYELKEFEIMDRKKEKFITSLSLFDVDFSDKEKISNKIDIYLTFL